MNLRARFFACLLVLLFCPSCKKDLGPCTGNCQVVQFSGIAVDPGAQKPLAGLTVTVDMPRRKACTFCGDYQVASGKTGTDGTFDLSVKVDTTLVVSRYCTVSVQGPAGYITYALPVGPGIEAAPASPMNELVQPLDSTGAAPYAEYDFFQRVLLTVQLHRRSAILPSAPSLYLTFSMSTLSSSAWGLNETSTNADTALTLYTGANVFTRINSSVFVTDSTTASQTDSIRCVPGGNNTVDINY
jgi:hypothetical protein